MKNDYLELAKRLEAETIGYRRHFHRHPELSGKEDETIRFVCERLAEFGVPYVEVKDGGVLGFVGDEAKGRTLILRADVDALPILENPRNLAREREVISEAPGAMHACGHDAHTAMLLTAAKLLKGMEAELKGRVILFFERGEEGGGNIRYLLRHIAKQNIRVDAAHAIHVDSDTPTGVFEFTGGPSNAGVHIFNVTIEGKGGHGSRPDLSSNPIDAFAAFHEAFSALRLRRVSPFAQLSYSVGLLQSGTRSNIIPGSLNFMGTLRYYDEATATAFMEEFRAVLGHICEAYHCAFKMDTNRFGMPVINNEKIAELIRGAVVDTLGEDRVRAPEEPSMGSETFSFCTKLFPSALIYLGVKNEELGSGAAHHNEYFDIDEAALAYGVAEEVAFARAFLDYGGDLPFKPYEGTIIQLLDENWPDEAER